MALTLNTFKVDTFIAAGQTLGAVLLTQVTGLLKYNAVNYRVTVQTAVVIGAVAALTSRLMSNFINNRPLQYLTIPVGVAIGLAAHRFLYMALPLPHLIKTFVIFTAALALVKGIRDLINYRNEKADLAVSYTWRHGDYVPTEVRVRV